ncbi:MAG: replication factor C large subunit [Candidatus Korarchaeota archaeon]|nr:replication factor C large subunit [Candidatus Korarchaeota archaeon]
MADLPWTEKYRPKSLDGIKGQNKAVSEIREWMRSVRAGKVSKALLLVGPPGSGKTSAAYAIAYELGYDPVEVNASDLRDRIHLKYVVESAKAVSLLTLSRRLIILDEVDALPSEGGALVSLVKELITKEGVPVVMTANDPYERHLYEIRSLSKVVRFYRLRWTTVLSVLKEICRKEGVKVPYNILRQIAVNSQGDLRAAINDLESLIKGSHKLSEVIGKKFGKRDVEADVFKVLTAVFYGENCYSAYLTSLNTDVDPDMLFRWVEENLPYVYKGRALSRAYDYLSYADIVRSRIIKTNNWKLLVYYTQLTTYAVCTAKEAKPQGVKMKFPEIIRKLATTKELRAKTREFLSRLARELHLPTKTVSMEIVPILIADSKREGRIIKRLERDLGLREEDIREILEDLEEHYKLEIRG